MDGRANDDTATNGRGEFGVGGNHNMNHGMNNGVMNSQNMQGMIGDNGMSGSHQQNGFQGTRNGMGGDMNGMNQGGSMRDDIYSRSTNPYLNTNNPSSLANRQGGNMNTHDPRSTIDYSSGYERGQEMNHNRNMDMDRRPGYVRLSTLTMIARLLF